MPLATRRPGRGQGHHVGDHGRTGEILEVLGEPGHEHFKVLWEDEHESVFFPSDDAVILRVAHSERS